MSRLTIWLWVVLGCAAVGVAIGPLSSFMAAAAIAGVALLVQWANSEAA